MDFSHDPLGFIDQVFADGRPGAWLPGRQFCIADAALGRSILRDHEGRFHESTDFFGSRDGALAPRSAQIAIGLEAKHAFRARWEAVRFDTVIANLPPVTLWPDTGNEIMFSIIRSIFVGEGRSIALGSVVTEIFEVRIRQRKRSVWRLIGRHSLRQRLEAAIACERSAGRAVDPDDILSVLFREAPGASDAQVAAAYASFLFAMAGSVGFALAWSLYLAGTRGVKDGLPDHIVHEALRLYPIAWLLGRRPLSRITLLGEEITPTDTVVVCPYAIQRNSAYWKSPNRFLPARWVERNDRYAWMPFGAGAHSCVAMALTIEVVAQCVAAVQQQSGWSVEALSEHPRVGPALRPPPFRLMIGASQL